MRSSSGGVLCAVPAPVSVPVSVPVPVPIRVAEVVGEQFRRVLRQAQREDRTPWGAFAAVISPPWMCAFSRAMERPRPLPSERGRDALAL